MREQLAHAIVLGDPSLVKQVTWGNNSFRHNSGIFYKHELTDIRGIGNRAECDST